MNKELKKELKREAREIKIEWKKHHTMNTCSVCDSPQGHRTMESLIDKAIFAEREMILKIIKEYPRLSHEMEEMRKAINQQDEA